MYLQISHLTDCSTLTGYQYKAAYDFHWYTHRTDAQPIDSWYMDGVRVARGPPGSRKHVWTFSSEDHADTIVYPCMCSQCITRHQGSTICRLGESTNAEVEHTLSIHWLRACTHFWHYVSLLITLHTTLSVCLQLYFGCCTHKLVPPGHC